MNKKRNVSRKVGFESMEGRRLLAAVIESEPNGTKLTADVGQVASTGVTQLVGSANKSDRDFFAMTFAAAGRYRVNTGEAAVKLDVENRLGVKLLETQPKDGITSGVIRANAGERLFFRVRGLENSASAYDVAIQQLTQTAPTQTLVSQASVAAAVVPTKVVESEPNGTKATADIARVASTGTTQLVGSANKRDSDFFAVTFTTAGTYKVNTGEASVKLDVENRLGVKVLDTEPKDGITSGTVTVRAGETLWFRVRGLNNDASAYAVNIQR